MSARDRRRGAKPPRPTAAAAGAPRESSRIEGAGLALFVALAATLALRAIAPFVPGRAWWGADLGRDLAPLAFWPAWVLSAAALVPALSARLALRLPVPGRAGATALVTAIALACGLLALASPERTLLTGDTAMRQGGFFAAPHPGAANPQAMPADLALHYHLPRAIAARTPLSPVEAARAWGALLAVAYVLAAWKFARTVATGAATTYAAFAAAAFTGGLALFNGYAKAPVEIECLTLVVAAAGLSIARGGGGAALLGLATAAALVLHRGALVLLPAWAAGLGLLLRRGRPARRGAGAWIGLLAPVAALAWAGPRLARTLSGFDLARHFEAAGAGGATGFAAAFSADHLHQASQAILLLAPLALALLALLVALGREWRRPAGLVLAALALPHLALLLLVRPQQGLFRDWDVFVGLGVVLSAAAAWAVARALDARPGRAWLAIPVALVAIAPSVQWLVLPSEPSRALARGASILEGPPPRPVRERAFGFDHIGYAYLDLGQYEPALDNFMRSLAAAPNPRTYVHVGMALTMLGRDDDALRSYATAVRLNPDLLQGWQGVAAAASRLHDLPHLAVAARALAKLDPDGSITRSAAAAVEAEKAAGR